MNNFKFNAALQCNGTCQQQDDLDVRLTNVVTSAPCKLNTKSP